MTNFCGVVEYSRREILDMFYDFKTFEFHKEKSQWQTKFDPNEYKRPIKLKTDLINPLEIVFHAMHIKM